jgi:endogenous inhibitor of DNA gyrase (YacG/DUF329 family)
MTLECRNDTNQRFPNMSKKPLVVECPNCKKKVSWNEDSPFRPFCSRRCQQIDFCGWANEENVISDDSKTDDLLSDELMFMQNNLNSDTQ